MDQLITHKPNLHATHHYFYHATTAAMWEVIKKTGHFKAGTYFGIEEIADYYADTLADEGDDVVIIAIPSALFDEDKKGIDCNGIDEPVCFSTMGKTESMVHDEWERSDKTVDDCINIIGSFHYHADLPLTESLNSLDSLGELVDGLTAENSMVVCYDSREAYV